MTVPTILERLLRRKGLYAADDPQPGVDSTLRLNCLSWSNPFQLFQFGFQGADAVNPTICSVRVSPRLAG